MGRYGQIDYPTATKRGLLLGVALFALGAGGELVGHALFGALPDWEHRLFLYAESLGILIGFTSVLFFGIVLPLTE